MRLSSIHLCVPVVEANGLDSVVSEHFGRAPFHVVVNLRSREVTTIEKENDCGESHGHCMPVDLLMRHGVNVVACKGIGRGAAARLVAEKIGVFATTARTVAEVVDGYEKQSLKLISESNLCSGHHNH